MKTEEITMTIKYKGSETSFPILMGMTEDEVLDKIAAALYYIQETRAGLVEGEVQ